MVTFFQFQWMKNFKAGVGPIVQFTVPRPTIVPLIETLGPLLDGNSEKFGLTNT
jgi:hypothetical protein